MSEKSEWDEGLSNRAVRALKSSGIYGPEVLFQHTKDSLRRIHGIGKSVFNEIDAWALSKYGRKFQSDFSIALEKRREEKRLETRPSE